MRRWAFSTPSCPAWLKDKKVRFGLKKIYWLGIALALFMALVVVMAVIVASNIEAGVTSEIGTGGQPLLAYDAATVPQSVIDDAGEVAAGIFGDDEAKCRDFAAQLLASYAEAKDHDFVLVFNSGGWGWNLLEESPGWWGIFEGIDAELATWDYTSVKLDYLRATQDFEGRLEEFWETLIGYHSKAEVLAARTEFFTDHLPDIRVILAGESTGAVIIDSAMVIMGDNPRVYSIQAGPPFWHTTITKERSLIMTGNGVSVDTLSHGNGFVFVLGCYQKWFGVLGPTADYGTEPHIVVAPGHDYWWQYPEVRSQITDFLKDNFAPEEIANN
jgi:hypothetical protein